MRRSASPHNPGVSLFPFLAVLICTMGVMMLLLVICNRPGADGAADDGAAANASPHAAAVEADIDTARDILTWQVSQLETARQKTEADLADRRLRLSAVEEHMRKLREDWQAMQLAAKDLEQVEHAKTEAVQLTEAQIAQLKQEVEQTKGQVAQAVERVRNQPPSFAIVPYDGPNGTRRRPIYIECGPDHVTLEPEGIVLTAEDFGGPSGPGNPLATILRAIRDYLAASITVGEQREPYPLLIVRPDGIESFYVARAAMASWASEFGYELIEQDRKLAYPPPNPQLAQVEQTALADARARYAWFAHTRTGRQETAGAQPMYRASVTGGGIVRTDQGPRHGSGDRGQGAGVGAFGDPRLAASPQASAAATPTGAFPASNDNNGATGGADRSRSAADGAFDSSGGLSVAKNDDTSANRDPTSPTLDPGSTVFDPEAQTRRELIEVRPPTPRSPHPGEFVDSRHITPPTPKLDEDDSKKLKSLAEQRGRNWSLPQAAKISVPVSRSIHIECRGDKMVILPDPGNAEPQVIPFGTRTEDSVDKLVAGVWSHTKGWGIAGRQMYWRPVLVLQLGPSGEGRFSELQALMANSGLDVTRK